MKSSMYLCPEGFRSTSVGTRRPTRRPRPGPVEPQRPMIAARCTPHWSTRRSPAERRARWRTHSPRGRLERSAPRAAPSPPRAASRLGETQAVRVTAGRGRCPATQSERLGKTGHRLRRTHHHAGPDVGARLTVISRSLPQIDCPVRNPAHSLRQSVHAPNRLAAVVPVSIGPTGRTIAGRRRSPRPSSARATSCRSLRSAPPRPSAARAPSPRCRRHQIAQEHAGRVREGLVHRDRGELHRQTAGVQHAAPDGRDQAGTFP